MTVMDARDATQPKAFTNTQRRRTLMGMLQELSHARSPQQVLGTFARGMVELDGPSAYVSLSTRDLEPGEYRITRLVSEDDHGRIEVADTWSNRERFAVHRGGLLGEIVEGGMPVKFDELQLDDDPVLGDRLASYRSLMASPLFDNGEPLNWTIRLRPEPYAFSEEDLEEQLMFGNLVGGTVRHVHTALALEEAQKRLNMEIDRIATLQHNLLPARFPRVPGVRFASSYQTFDRAGGDMYFFQKIGEDAVTGMGEHNGLWGLFVGDVAGHGPAAAVIMAMIEAILGTMPSVQVRSTGEALAYLNKHLCFKQIGATFVTGWIAAYDPATGLLEYANAGHNPPLLFRRRQGRCEVIALRDGGGLPLAITSDEVYANTSIHLRDGDVLVLYTDGITESRNPQGEFFGEQGLIDALRQCEGDPESIVATIRHRLLAFQAGGRPQDDQTLLVMQIDHVGKPGGGRGGIEIESESESEAENQGGTGIEVGAVGDAADESPGAADARDGGGQNGDGPGGWLRH